MQLVVTEESTLVPGEPNITVKVCVSLKRPLAVTFNIKAIRIQSSKCSDPVKLPFGWIRSLCFINQTNLYMFIKTLCKTRLRKNYCLTFSMSPLSALLTSLLYLFHLLLKWLLKLPKYCLPHVLQLKS